MASRNPTPSFGIRKCETNRRETASIETWTAGRRSNARQSISTAAAAATVVQRPPGLANADRMTLRVVSIFPRYSKFCVVHPMIDIRRIQVPVAMQASMPPNHARCFRLPSPIGQSCVFGYSIC